MRLRGDDSGWVRAKDSTLRSFVPACAGM